MLNISQPRSSNYVAGALLACFSVYAIGVKEFTIGIPGLLLALAVITTYNYVAFDFAAGYRGKFTCLFSIFPLGGWDKMPRVKHVFIKRFSSYAQEEISDSGVYQTIKDERYIILFSVFDATEGVVVFEVPELNKARKIAQEISVEGGLELLDYTH